MLEITKHLQDIIFEMIEYAVSSDDEKGICEFRRYLMGKNPSFGNDIVENFDCANIVFSREQIFLLMLSNYYKVRLYQGVPTEEDREIMAILSNGNPIPCHPMESLDIENFVDHIIEGNVDYFNLSYITHYRIEKYILQQGETETICRLNPLEIVHYLFLPDSEYYAESEFLVQDILDRYWSFVQEYSTGEYNPGETLESHQNLSEEDQIIFRELQAWLLETYPDFTLVSSVVLYIIANVYEAMHLPQSIYCDRELLELIDRTDNRELVQKMLKDIDFYNQIIRIFLRSNECFGMYSLLISRHVIKEKHLEGKVKKLNPFYAEEERKWKARQKESQSEVII